MKKSKPLMGLCPIGKFVFSNEDAVKYKKLLQQKLKEWEVDYTDLEGVLEDGLIKDQKHVDIAVDHFCRAGVDCLFVPHCNFGTEGAVGMIAKKLNVPTLLWGPRDESPLSDGRRLRDTLCGMLASSKVLHKLGVPFTYIENCRMDDKLLQCGIDTFLRAVSVANVFRKGVKIGHVGQRIDFFWTTIINESELLERFNIEVLPIDIVEFIEAVRNRVSKGRPGYLKEVKMLRAVAKVEGFDNDDALINVYAVRDQLLALGRDHGLEGFAIQDFMSLINAMGAYCFYANSLVSEHYPIGCESDIHGAISNILLNRAGFNAASTYLVDVTIRHPDNDNGVLLWHAGAPVSMCHSDEKVRIGDHWILPSPLSGMPHFRMKDGPITVARFDGDGGEYSLAIGEGKSIDGPETQNTYVWMEVDNWPRWERILMEGPFIHHIGMTYGHYAHALTEACKYVDGLKPVILNGTKFQE